MIFKKNFIKETSMVATGVFTVLFIILVSTQSINLLGRASEGRIAVEAVFALIGFWSLGLFPVLLILTVFISLITVFTRYWRDSEMSVWLSGGLSLKCWITPVCTFAIPFALLVMILSLFVTPWASQRSKEYAETLKQREELSVVSPGIFTEVGKDKKIYFVEKFSPETGAAENIFMQALDKNGRNTIVLAKSGYLLTENGERKLVLENGYRYTGEAGQADFETLNFGRSIAVIDQAPKIISAPNDKRTIPTSAILHTSNLDFQAELIWRLSLPVSVVILALLTIPLSYYNPRTGHTYNLFFALLVYLIYQNGLTFLQDFIEKGQVSPWGGFILLHGSMGMLAFLLLQYRSQGKSFIYSLFKAAVKSK